jgi:hypothetical protein
MDSNWKADPRGELPCPFCAGRITFPLDENDEHTAVFHTLPPCRVYLETDDALDFAKRCNLEVARRRGVGLT